MAQNKLIPKGHNSNQLHENVLRVCCVPAGGKDTRKSKL